MGIHFSKAKCVLEQTQVVTGDNVLNQRSLSNSGRSQHQTLDVNPVKQLENQSRWKFLEPTLVEWMEDTGGPMEID